MHVVGGRDQRDVEPNARRQHRDREDALELRPSEIERHSGTGHVRNGQVRERRDARAETDGADAFAYPERQQRVVLRRLLGQRVHLGLGRARIVDDYPQPFVRRQIRRPERNEDHRRVGACPRVARLARRHRTGCDQSLVRQPAALREVAHQRIVHDRQHDVVERPAVGLADRAHRVERQREQRDGAPDAERLVGDQLRRGEEILLRQASGPDRDGTLAGDLAVELGRRIGPAREAPAQRRQALGQHGRRIVAVRTHLERMDRRPQPAAGRLGKARRDAHDRRQPVDDRVMDLRVDGETAALHAVDHQQLEQRALAVHALRVQHLDQLAQLVERTRRRQRHVPHVVAHVDVVRHRPARQPSRGNAGT